MKNRIRCRRRSRNIPMIVMAIIVSIFGIGFVAISRDLAEDALTRHGYRNIQMTGWRPFNLWCGHNSGMAQGFSADTSEGKHTTGYVCTKPIYSFVVTD